MARKIWILIENSWARDNLEDVAIWLQIIMNSGKDTQHVVESIYHVKTRPILVVELPSGVPLDLLLGEHDPNAFLKPPWRGGQHESSPVIIFEYVTKGNLKSLRNSWNEYTPKKPFQNSSQLQSFPVMNPYPPPKRIPTRPGNNPPSSIPSHWVKKLVSPSPPLEPEHHFNGFGENGQDNHGLPSGSGFAEDNLGGIQNAESKETVLKTGKFHPTSSCPAHDKPHNYAKKEEDPMPLPSSSKLKDEDPDSGSSDIFYQLNGLGKYRPVVKPKAESKEEPTEVALDKFGTHIKTEAQENQTPKVEADGLDYYLSLLPPSKQVDHDSKPLMLIPKKEDIGKERPKEESMELDLEDVKPAVVSLENLGKRTRATSISQHEKDTKRPRFQKTSPQIRQRRNSDLASSGGGLPSSYFQFEPLPPDSRSAPIASNSAQDGSSFQIGSSYWFRNLPEAIQTSLLVRIETRPEDRYLDNVYLNAIGRLAAVGIGETISVAFDQESIRTIHAPFVQPVPPSAEETGQIVAVLDGPLKNQVAVVRDWEDEDTAVVSPPGSTTFVTVSQDWLCQMART